MLIQIRKRSEEKECAVTPQEIYRQRRVFIQQCAAGAVGMASGLLSQAAEARLELGVPKPSQYSTDEEQTSQQAATHYNNFYELGTGKEDPSRNAALLKTEPWSVEVEGHCDNPGTYAIEDLVPMHKLEERIYRLR